MFTEIIQNMEETAWQCLGIPILICFGIWIFFRSNFLALRIMSRPIKTFSQIDGNKSKGISPIRIMLTSASGMIGVANISAVSVAIAIGGPGVLFWLWIAGFLAMGVKYYENYLGVAMRQSTVHGFKGGPGVFLANTVESIFCKKTLVILFALLMGIYAADPFIFSTVSSTFTNVTHISKEFSVAILVIITVFTAIGGVTRLTSVCTFLTPFFIALYMGISSIIICTHLTIIPGIIKNIFVSAFHGHAPLGGFMGSSAILALTQGISRGTYSTDTATGFSSVLCSESNVKDPYDQAKLSIWSTFFDIMFATISGLLVLISGVWASGIPSNNYVLLAVEQYFYSASTFVDILLMLVGWSSAVAYLTVGLKVVKQTFGAKSVYLYLGYTIFIYSYFSLQKHASLNVALSLMSLVQACMVSLNLFAFVKLRSFVKFSKRKKTVA